MIKGKLQPHQQPCALSLLCFKNRRLRRSFAAALSASTAQSNTRAGVPTNRPARGGASGIPVPATSRDIGSWGRRERLPRSLTALSRPSHGPTRSRHGPTKVPLSKLFRCRVQPCVYCHWTDAIRMSPYKTRLISESQSQPSNFAHRCSIGSIMTLALMTLTRGPRRGREAGLGLIRANLE